MERTRRRALTYVVIIVGAVTVYTLAYKFGMQAFEGESRTLLESLEIVIQTFTTTGYGEDAPWTSRYMLSLVIMMQLSGVLLIFLTLPVFVLPWLEQRLEVRPPTTFEGSGHVVISGFSERIEALIEELESQGIEYVALVPNREQAVELHDAGYTVAIGDPEATDDLEAVSVSEARAVVLDRGNEANATIALTVRELTETVRLVAFIDDSELAPYLELAGVDTVLLPRDLLGRRLADKVTSVITTQLGETVDIGEDLEIIELPLQKGCELEGRSLAESGLREQTGANIIGAWIDGGFVPNPDPDVVLDRTTVLLVSGEKSQLKAAMELTMAEGRPITREVVIAGYGEVGATVRESLRTSQIGCTVIDLQAGEDVDVVGDATDEETLREAGIEEAGALIISLPDDTDTVFTTLVAREANENIDIIARANETESSLKLYAAGADYVLALSLVSGRMLAESILEEEVISYETQIEIVRAEAPAFESKTLGEADIRAKTGSTVIAIERDGTVHTDLGPAFSIESGDSLVVAGADEDIARFNEIAGVHSGTR